MRLQSILEAAKSFGLSRLSKETGMARSYLYKLVDGSTSPTVDSLEKIAQVLGFEIFLQRAPIKGSAREASSLVAADGQWKIHFFNFVDTFRKRPRFELIKDQAVESLPEKELALLCSIVIQLCKETNTQTPHWAATQKPLKEPLFLSGFENLKPMAILESPLAFRRNNIFVLKNFLSRV